MMKKTQKKTSHGGARKGAGRKPVDDKKVTLILYPHQSTIELLGAETAKDIAIKALEQAAKKIKQS